MKKKKIFKNGDSIKLDDYGLEGEKIQEHFDEARYLKIALNAVSLKSGKADIDAWNTVVSFFPSLKGKKLTYLPDEHHIFIRDDIVK